MMEKKKNKEVMMRRRTYNYSSDSSTLENINNDDKYVETGESEFSRDLTVPFDENDVLTERHIELGGRIIDLDMSGKGPKGYRRPDEMIYEDVCEALWRSPDVDPSEIEVNVNQGIVLLKGTVYDRQFKRSAERLAESVAGVIDIKNDIRVEPNHPLIENRYKMN